MALELTPYHAGIPAVVFLYGLFNMYQSISVSAARKKYGVEYPTMYASEADNKNAKAFNSIQRGHQNCLETVAQFFATLILGGIQHPIAATILGLLYIVARLAYFQGYKGSGPGGRMKGIWHYFCLFGLQGLTASFAVHLYLTKSS